MKYSRAIASRRPPVRSIGVRVSKYFAAADQYSTPPPRLVSVTTLSPSRAGAVTRTGSGAVSDAASKDTVFTVAPLTETSTANADGRLAARLHERRQAVQRHRRLLRAHPVRAGLTVGQQIADGGFEHRRSGLRAASACTAVAVASTLVSAQSSSSGSWSTVHHASSPVCFTSPTSAVASASPRASFPASSVSSSSARP